MKNNELNMFESEVRSLSNDWISENCIRLSQGPNYAPSDLLNNLMLTTGKTVHILLTLTKALFELNDKLDVIDTSHDVSIFTLESLNKKVKDLEDNSKVTDTKIENLNFAVDLMLEEFLELRDDFKDALLVSTYEEDASFLPVVGEILNNPGAFTLEG